MVNRILFAAIILLTGFLAGRTTSALVPVPWIDDHTTTAAVPDRWLATVARKSTDAQLRERGTCDVPRLKVIGMADDLCPADDPTPRLMWPQPRY